MAFSTNPLIHPGDSGPAPVNTIPAACEIWFTSTGRVLPKLIKFPDETGNILTLSDFHVYHSERHFYCGIPSFVYYCKTILSKKRILFRLFFYPESCTWKLLWEEMAN